MSPLDLLSWPEVTEARQRVAAAVAAREEAGRRVRTAPHGELQNRQSALREAVHAELAATAALFRLLKAELS